jgi:hypothetical protein
MQVLSRDELKALLSWRNEPCVSVYMPLHRAGAETQQEPIRLKNLLRKAETQLVERGMRAPEAKVLLKPAVDLQSDEQFWVYHRADGLALFVAPGLFHHYRVPHSFDELAVVGETFHVKPLLRLFADEGRFYLLALSQKAVQLYEGGRLGLTPLSLPDGCPTSLEEAQGGAQFDRSLQHHASAPGGDGGMVGMVHGHAPEDLKKKWLEKYVRTVAKHVDALLKGERRPLILAAVDYYQPMLRDVLSYPHVVEQGVVGSPDHWGQQELHERAWAIAEPWFTQRCNDAAQRHRQLSGTDRAPTELEQIVPAAHAGRVEVVFAAQSKQVWGIHQTETGRVEFHEQPQPGDVDLLNLAVEQTLLHGGDAYVVDAASLPGSAPQRVAAALLRW